MKQITTRVETITPEVSKYYLERNKHNRPVNVSNVNKLVHALENKEWQVNGQPIIIDWNDNVGDGQHRFMACMETGISFDTVVVRGISPDAFKTIDTGKVRSAGDVLNISGVVSKKSSKIASIVKKYRGFTEECVTRPKPMSNTEVLQSYDHNQTFYLEGLEMGRDFYTNNPHISDTQWSVAFLALFDLDRGVEYLKALRDQIDDVAPVTKSILIANKGKSKEARKWVAIINGYDKFIEDDFTITDKKEGIKMTVSLEAKVVLNTINYPSI